MENERPKFVPASVQSDIADLTAADEGLTRHRKRVSFRAKQVRKEILSGIDVAELMDRYGLSERGLKKFLKGVLEQGVVTKEELDRWQSAQEPGPPDVPTTPEASATTSQILRGLRSGMSKLELMDKHGLTSEQLESVVNEAVAKGVLHCSELDTCTEKLKTAEFRSLFIDQVPTPSQSGEPAEIEIPADIPPIGRPGSTTTIKQIKTSEGIGLLIESLGHTDKRETAREKLVAFGDQAVEPLLAAIHHDDAEIRSRVPLLLADLGAAQAVEPIIALLNDPDAEVRESALMALDTLKDTRSLDPMLQALTHDSEPHNRRLAAINLGHLKDSRTIPALLEALRTEGEDWARAGAAIGLGYCANIPRVKAALLESSADLDYSATSIEAMEALRRTGAVPVIGREEPASPPETAESPPKDQPALQTRTRRSTVLGIVIGLLIVLGALLYLYSGGLRLF